jgi:glycosyltransferase involved in cell wall biosynthesis
MHAATILLVFNCLIALFWITRILSALRNLPRIPNLLDAQYARALATAPASMISVIVPARNEAQEIEATLRSLLAIEGVPLEIFAVNDRSTDATGAIMDRLAAEALHAGTSITVLHITDLPAGWMGKTHAMALAARQATTPWLLFTDADILFSKDSLLRAMNLAAEQQADHVVIFPTLILESFGERMMIAVFQGIAAVFSRAWKISDSRSRDTIGVGAFNLIRADVYRAIGGFEALKMEVVEDLRLGVEVKRKGFRQRVAFGRNLVRVRWIVGAMGFVRNVTKNFFAIFRFRALPAIIGGSVFAVLCLGPFVAVFGSWPMCIPAVFVMGMLLLLYRYYRRFTGIPAAYAFTFPFAACLLLYAIARSVIVSFIQGGIHWRGTFYPLAELRRNAGPVR